MAGEGESVRSGGESVRSGGQRIVAVERRGEGVDRRAAHQEPLAGAVVGVAEYGRHYVLRQPAESQEARWSGCAGTRRRGWPGTLSSR